MVQGCGPAGKASFGLLVSGEAVAGRIPFQFASQPQGESQTFPSVLAAWPDSTGEMGSCRVRMLRKKSAVWAV